MLNFTVAFTTLNLSNLIYRSAFNSKMSKSNSKVTKSNLNCQTEILNSSENPSVAITEQECHGVRANKLAIEKEGKSVFDTVNMPCFQSDLKVIPCERLNTLNIQSDSSSVKLSTESESVKDVKSLEKAYTKSSPIKSEDIITLMSSDSVDKLPKVSLKVVDEKGRKRKFRINLKQRMARLVCL